MLLRTLIINGRVLPYIAIIPLFDYAKCYCLWRITLSILKKESYCLCAFFSPSLHLSSFHPSHLHILSYVWQDVWLSHVDYRLFCMKVGNSEPIKKFHLLYLSFSVLTSIKFVLYSLVGE